MKYINYLPLTIIAEPMTGSLDIDPDVYPKFSITITDSCGRHWYLRTIGRDRYDIYDLYSWLVKKFDRSVPDITTWIRSANVFIKEGCIRQGGIDVDTCDYYFIY